MLEAVDEPTAGRPRRAVGPVDSYHVDNVAPRRRMIGCDFNERAACEFPFDGMQGHGSETKAGAQESQLGAEVREAPNFWILRAGRHEQARHVVRINMRDLDVFGEYGGRYPPAATRKRVLWRNNHGHPNWQQHFVGKLRGYERP